MRAMGGGRRQVPALRVLMRAGSTGAGERMHRKRGSPGLTPPLYFLDAVTPPLADSGWGWVCGDGRNRGRDCGRPRRRLPELNPCLKSGIGRNPDVLELRFSPASAIQTLLHMTSFILAGETLVIPGQLPCFSGLLSLDFWGRGKTSTTGTVTGSVLPEPPGASRSPGRRSSREASWRSRAGQIRKFFYTHPIRQKIRRNGR